MITEALSKISLSAEIHNNKEMFYPRDILLTRPYLLKLTDINTELKKANINYAVVGSLGISLTCNESFNPFENKPIIRNGQITQTMRDIDIMVLGNESEKQIGRQIIQKINKKSNEEPFIDLTKSLMETINYENGHWYLCKKKIQTLVNLEVSTRYSMLIPDYETSLPVLHPEIQLLLLQLNNPISKISKIEKRISSLKKFIYSDENNFPIIRNETRQQFFRQLIKTIFLDTSNTSVGILKKYYAKKIEGDKNQWLKKGVNILKKNG